MKINRVISLGYNCGSAYQIRLHTRIKEAYLFDWLYTSTDSIISVLSNDFKDVFLKQNLKITRNETELTDLNHGLRFNHSFKVDKKIIKELLESNYETEFAKFQYLCSKMKKVFNSGEKILFIRYNPYPGRRDSKNAILQIEELLCSKVKNKNFAFFWVVNEAQEKIVKRTNLSNYTTLFEIDEIPTRSKSHLNRSFINTDDVAWSKIFESLEIIPGTQKLLLPNEPVIDKRQHVSKKQLSK